MYQGENILHMINRECEKLGIATEPVPDHSESTSPRGQSLPERD